MNTKHVISKIQAGFDWLKNSLEPIENRWLVFILTCFFIILMQAIGAKGLALLAALFYIMYFVTLKL